MQAIDRLIELEMMVQESHMPDPPRDSDSRRSHDSGRIDEDVHSGPALGRVEPRGQGDQGFSGRGGGRKGDRDMGGERDRDRDFGTIQLHVSGINPSVQDHHIRDFFKDYTRCVLRIHRRRETYCFIHFSDIETAVEVCV